jgi:hypothetical protein
LKFEISKEAFTRRRKGNKTEDIRQFEIRNFKIIRQVSAKEKGRPNSKSGGL